jgi:phosphohistidine phosphatase
MSTRELLIMRHGKSDWSDPLAADINRPLKKRGTRNARRMGLLMRDEHLLPDLIITSPATRARRTAEELAAATGYTGKIEEERSFYPGGPEDYIRALRGVATKHRRVLVVGHNPGLEWLLERLTGTDAILPTAALARILFSIDHWRELTEQTRGELKNVWRPRELS